MGKRRKNNTNSETAVVEIPTGKNKKIKFDETEDNDDSPIETSAPSKKNKTKNKTVQEPANDASRSKKNKKIKFDEDGSAQDEHESQSTSQTRKTPNQSAVQDDEENIKDEDIDKFCDEITEEDNEQFENWVKLIEAKLQPSKKASKKTKEVKSKEEDSS